VRVLDDEDVGSRSGQRLHPRLRVSAEPRVARSVAADVARGARGARDRDPLLGSRRRRRAACYELDLVRLARVRRRLAPPRPLSRRSSDGVVCHRASRFRRVEKDVVRPLAVLASPVPTIPVERRRARRVAAVYLRRLLLPELRLRVYIGAEERLLFVTGGLSLPAPPRGAGPSHANASYCRDHRR
jgi:hypothetical protein